MKLMYCISMYITYFHGGSYRITSVNIQMSNFYFLLYINYIILNIYIMCLIKNLSINYLK